MIHAGDLINSGNRDAEWGEWFGAGGWLNAMVPSVPTPGNHEYPATRTSRIRPAVVAPLAAAVHAARERPGGLEETVYWLDYQGVRIISLNSNEQQAASRSPGSTTCWATIPTRGPCARFITRSSRRPRAATIRRSAQLWKPIFDKYSVDLVLQGHDHTYGRFGQELSRERRHRRQRPQPRGRHGVCRLGQRARRCTTSIARPDDARAAEDTQLYQIISIDGDTLRYEARTATGELYDAFRLNETARRDSTSWSTKSPTRPSGWAASARRSRRRPIRGRLRRFELSKICAFGRCAKVFRLFFAITFFACVHLETRENDVSGAHFSADAYRVGPIGWHQVS